MSVVDLPPNTKPSPYRMTISLNVLNHLGIGLYSNVPAVLSEVVANAWDADANVVDIRIDRERGEICIFDDGSGMNLEDVNDRYLTVGYRKRDEITGLTSGGRHPMGRKGIGKLSVFSIADTVEVYSAKDGQRHAFSMNSEKIQEEIKVSKTDTYHPLAIGTEDIDFERGTKILLKDLKKGFRRTEEFSRRRLARRFSIIGPQNEFEVKINGEPITTKDRGFYDKIEFLWHMGKREDLDEGFFEDGDGSELRANIKQTIELETDRLLDDGWAVTGWIGTVDEQKSIDDENNAITIFAHGKLIHEDILGDLKEGGIFSKYLIGEIYANFMDSNDEDDIVTSDRQSVKQDDERYEKLKELVRVSLKKIQNRWTNLRNDRGTERATEHPSIKIWYERLSKTKRKTAQTMFGRIESLVLSSEAKVELYKSGMLAFERLALKDSLDQLGSRPQSRRFQSVRGTLRDCGRD